MYSQKLRLFHGIAAGPVYRFHILRKSIMPETRSEPRTDNPLCIGDRRQPLRHRTRLSGSKLCPRRLKLDRRLSSSVTSRHGSHVLARPNRFRLVRGFCTVNASDSTSTRIQIMITGSIIPTIPQRQGWIQCKAPLVKCFESQTWRTEKEVS